MSAASTPAGCISCHLCNASISIKTGSFEKFQAHLEKSHEIFYGYEALIALAFLEDHEKEVIVEKVLPRMKLVLDTAKSHNKNYPTGAKLDIEKKLCDDEEASEVKEDTEHVEQFEGKGRDTEELEKNEEEENGYEESEDEDENPSKRSRLDMIDVNESLEISLDESDETLFFPDDPTQDPGVLGVGGDKPKDTVECPICLNNFKKKSMNKHKQRCELRERVRQMDLAKQAKLAQEKKKEKETIVTIDEEGEQAVEDLELSQSSAGGSGTGCQVCGKNFSSKTNLRRHLRNVHRDTASHMYS